MEDENKKIKESGQFMIPYEQSFRDLKSEFIKIREFSIGRQMTRAIVEEMDVRFRDLFKHFALDIHFRLEPNYEIGIVTFVPLREIDKLAVRGILSL